MRRRLAGRGRRVSSGDGWEEAEFLIDDEPVRARMARTEAELQAQIAAQEAEIAALRAQLVYGPRRRVLSRPLPSTLDGKPLKPTFQRRQVWLARDVMWRH